VEPHVIVRDEIPATREGLPNHHGGVEFGGWGWIGHGRGVDRAGPGRVHVAEEVKTRAPAGWSGFVVSAPQGLKAPWPLESDHLPANAEEVHTLRAYEEVDVPFGDAEPAGELGAIDDLVTRLQPDGEGSAVRRGRGLGVRNVWVFGNRCHAAESVHAPNGSPITRTPPRV